MQFLKVLKILLCKHSKRNFQVVLLKILLNLSLLLTTFGSKFNFQKAHFQDLAEADYVYYYSCSLIISFSIFPFKFLYQLHGLIQNLILALQTFHKDHSIIFSLYKQIKHFEYRSFSRSERKRKTVRKAKVGKCTQTSSFPKYLTAALLE